MLVWKEWLRYLFVCCLNTLWVFFNNLFVGLFCTCIASCIKGIAILRYLARFRLFCVRKSFEHFSQAFWLPFMTFFLWWNKAGIIYVEPSLVFYLYFHLHLYSNLYFHLYFQSYFHVHLHLLRICCAKCADWWEDLKVSRLMWEPLRTRPWLSKRVYYSALCNTPCLLTNIRNTNQNL